MGVSLQKALVELRDEELWALLPQISKSVNYSYNDVLQEIERRRIVSDSKRTFWLSLAALIIAVISLVASILVALFGH
jgi:hypothetical protein